MGPLRRVLITASVAGCILAGANASAALAATYKVNSTADTGGTCSPAPASCTLRQAVTSATSGSDTINVQAGHYLLGSNLSITANVTINGAGAATTNIDANNGSSVFIVSASVSSLTLHGVKVSNAKSPSGDNGGGLLWNASGNATLTIDHCVFDRNSATGGGSGGGADVTAGVGTLTVNITDSTFSLNKAGPSGGNGGGLDAEGGTGASTVNVTRSTFSSNTADSNGDGGALYFSGGSDGNALNITASTFSGNSMTAGDGGAIWYLGSGTSTAIVKNSTFAGNGVGSGTGGAFFLSSVTATLTNDTIAANTASGGNDPGISGAGGVTAHNTIIADISSGNDCGVAVASSDHSLQSGNAGCGLDITGNPKLAALANNGGPTKTMAEQTGSAAIDAGHSTKCPATDQRGFPRFDNGESTCDIGAFEVNDDHSGPAITIITPADGAHYKQGQKVNANYHCSDPSGVAFCQGPAPNGKPIDTSTLGGQSFTVQARDKLGHTSTKTVHYTVVSTVKSPPVVKGFPPNQGCVPRGLKLKISVHPTRLRLAAVFLDGKLIASSNKPGFKVKISGKGLGPGRHTVKILREYKSGTKRRSTFSFASCRHGGRSPHIHTEGTPDRGTCTAKPFSIFVSITRVDVKTIRVKLDGKQFAKPGKAKFTLSIDVSKLKVGKHRLVISAADKFKNGSASITDFVVCR